MSLARNTEHVIVEFTVDKGGSVWDPKVVESSLGCLNYATIITVRKWKYLPKIENGERVARVGVQTKVTYELSSSPGDGPAAFRMGVAKKLWAVRDDLKKGKSAKAALEQLAQIEAEFGKTFMRAELSTFHQLRGVARMEVGDLRGALDDLRIAKSTSPQPDETNEMFDSMIRRLEIMIAAEEKAKAGEPAKEGGDPKSNPAETPAKPAEE